MNPLHAHNKQAARERARSDSPTKPNRYEPRMEDCDRYMQIAFKEHFAHGYWQSVGRCVYCACGDRLFQGTLPSPTTTIEIINE